MSRKDFDRAEIELQTLESELKQRLIHELTEIASGRNTLFFFNDEHNPHDFPAHFLPEQSSELLMIARKSIELRKLLVMPTEQSVGQLFITACEENANLDNPHRLGPRRLAARLLSQIVHEST